MSVPTLVRDHCLAPSRLIDASADPGARYGRLFPKLPPLSVDKEALLALGGPGGVCDGGTACVDARGASGWPLHAPRANLEPLYGGGPAGEPYL